jgi:ribosomal protein S12
VNAGEEMPETAPSPLIAPAVVKVTVETPAKPANALNVPVVVKLTVKSPLTAPFPVKTARFVKETDAMPVMLVGAGVISGKFGITGSLTSPTDQKPSVESLDKNPDTNCGK